MEFIIGFIRIIIWWMLFDTALAAGRLQSPFLLIVSIIGMTYWYWRYPVFKDDENPKREG